MKFLFYFRPCTVPYTQFPAGNYMFKFNNRNIRTRYEIRSKLTIGTLERRHYRLTGMGAQKDVPKNKGQMLEINMFASKKEVL